jgi:hypothetical protein
MRHHRSTCIAACQSKEVAELAAHGAAPPLAAVLARVLQRVRTRSIHDVSRKRIR